MEEITHIYTITELTRKIKELLELKFTSIWVEGEISNFKHDSSKHMYFSLKDENSLMHAAMFKGANQRLKFKPEDGLHVIAHGTISVYEKRGDYQIIVEYLEPVGLGALQLAFEQLKEKLEKEGLFDVSRKKPIPKFPNKIGIITSLTGAAIKDMLNIINRRFANVSITIYPVRVQGEGAAKEISQAIEDMNKMKNFDVLIVGRGGGSLEDLWAFNEETVARAIYNSRIPVISAVGHEIDFTISDFVADLRASTPSAAAELVVKEKQEILNYINSIDMRIKTAITNILENFKERFNWIKSHVIFREPMTMIREYQQIVDDLAGRLGMHIQHIVEIQKRNLEITIGRLEALSPLSVLARGYSLCLKFSGGSLVKNSNSVEIKEKLRIILNRGQLICSVEKIEEDVDGIKRI